MRRFLPTLVLALAAATASGQDWAGELKMIDNDLRTQRYAHARKWSIKMINSMCDHLGTGPDSMYTLAITTAYRAMAEAGLKNMDDADWYWHVALSMYPKLAKNDWKPYGEPGEFLARDHSDEFKISASESAKPVPIRKTEPKCPLSAIQGEYYQPITVRAIVGADGNARCPTLISASAAPTLIYAATEALKQWQFEPLSAPANYDLTINFVPPRQ
jgi:hypothetical protein